MNRFFLVVGLAAGLGLSGCSDARRPMARAYLETNPPPGFAVVEVPKEISVMTLADGSSEATARVRYRLLDATIERRDGFTLLRATKVIDQLAALRGWALSTLPADHPARTAILSGVAAARAAFPIKRVVTPAGTELEAIATVELRQTGAAWQVEKFHSEAAVPGTPDSDAAVPFEDSPQVTARLQQLETTFRQMDGIRREYLAARWRLAERSRADLRILLQTGRTFDGTLPGDASVRLVISRGLDAGESVVAVLTVHGAESASTRFSGRLISRSSGELIFRSVQAAPLSAAPETTTASDPKAPSQGVLTLFTSANGLAGQLEIHDRPPAPLSLRPGPPADLIPDVAPSHPALP